MRMALHMARGLGWLHSKGIAHRDVKSLNVLVTEDYSCKYADFGTAKLISDQQILHTMNAGIIFFFVYSDSRHTSVDGTRSKTWNVQFPCRYLQVFIVPFMTKI